MSLPGPAFGPWAVALVVGALGFTLVGESVRRGLAHYSPWARTMDGLERVLVDLYLGGGVLFGIAALPFGLYYPFTPGLVVAAASVLLAAELVVERRKDRSAGRPGPFLRSLGTPPVAIALASALALFLVELATALQTPTGNTFDSSLLTYYVAHLGLAHSIPLNFLPAAPFGNPYPQGTTVWLAAFQSAFGLPPARTSLFVTPLFLGLAPLGAFVAGDRLLGSSSAGATFAVIFAFVGSWTRVLVAGSNDFVFAFPLLLVLFSRAGAWTERAPLRWSDALVFGGLAGVAVTLNPAGPIWLFLTIAVLGGLTRPAWGGRIVPWFARWAAAVGTGIFFALPSLYEEVAGPNGLFYPGIPPGAVAPLTNPGGISFPQFVGLTDPFLFRGTDVWLSPFGPIRDEIAVLIGVGALVLLFSAGWPFLREGLHRFRRVALSGIGVALGILGLGLLTGSLGGPGRPFLALTSFAETSILLFTLYTMVAAVPVFLLVRWAQDEVGALPDRRPIGSTAPRKRTSRIEPGAGLVRATLAIGAICLLVAPGMAVTVGELPGYETGLYRAFGNVTQGDLDLLEWAGHHVAPGARILVAPGSAAGFLPGYVPTAVVLFPMVDGVFVNASYQTLVRELTNATLDAVGESALASLSVGFIAVTGNSSQLYRAFSPAPLLQDPGFPVLFHEGDAYLFERAVPPSPG